MCIGCKIKDKLIIVVLILFCIICFLENNCGEIKLFEWKDIYLINEFWEVYGLLLFCRLIIFVFIF